MTQAAVKMNAYNAMTDIENIVTEHTKAVTSFFSKNAEQLDAFADVCVQAFENGNKIMLCGNGGSASDAQHIAAEFVGRFLKDRRSLPSIALTTDTSILTAVGNDYGYDQVFSRQVEGLGEKGDVLIAITTSGNSENILKAVDVAKEKGVTSMALTGKTGGKINGTCDYNFVVEHPTTAHIQECHIMMLHTLCTLIEKKMGFQ